MPSVEQNSSEQLTMHASVLAYPNAAYPGSGPSTPSQIRLNAANAKFNRPPPAAEEFARRSFSPEKMVWTNASPAGVCVPRPYTSVTRKLRAFVGGLERIWIWSRMTCAAGCRLAVPSAGVRCQCVHPI